MQRTIQGHQGRSLRILIRISVPESIVFIKGTKEIKKAEIRDAGSKSQSRLLNVARLNASFLRMGPH